MPAVTAILGIHVRRNQTVTPHELTALAGHLWQHGLSGLKMIFRNHVGLVQHAIGSEVAVDTASPWGNLGLEEYAAVFMGRLDNRSALCREMNLHDKDMIGIPDPEIVKLAYVKWGIECPNHLLGDWAFALWDDSQDHLIVARDPCGRATLYYCYNPTLNRLVFSSQLSGILAMPGIARRLNPDYIAQHVSGITRRAATPYEGIDRLLPGYMLIATERKIDVRQYWSVRSVPEVRLSSSKEYAEDFLDVFSEAVRCRVANDGPVGAFLSGGLDSGAVTTLAAQILSDHGKQIQAFCAVPRFDSTGLISSSRTGDETELARQVADLAGHIPVAYLPSAQTTIMDGIRASLAHVV